MSAPGSTVALVWGIQVDTVPLLLASQCYKAYHDAELFFAFLALRARTSTLILYEDKRRSLVGGIRAESWCIEPPPRSKSSPPVEDLHDSFNGLQWPLCCFTSYKFVGAYMNAFPDRSEQLRSSFAVFGLDGFAFPTAVCPIEELDIPSLVIGLAAEPCSAGMSPPTDHLGAMAPFQSKQSIILHDDDEVFNQRKITSVATISPISEDGQKRLSREMRVLRLTKARAAGQTEPAHKQIASNEREDSEAEVGVAIPQAGGKDRDNEHPSLILVHTAWVGLH